MMNTQRGKLPPRKRLSSLHSETVACGVVHALVRALRSVMLSLCNADDLCGSAPSQLRDLLADPASDEWREHALKTPIADMVMALTHYAQRGGDTDRFEDWMLVVCNLVHRPALPPEPWRELESYFGLLDRSSDFGVVAKAGHVRFGIDHGGRATVDEIGAMTGLEDAAVRKLLGGAEVVDADKARQSSLCRRSRDSLPGEPHARRRIADRQSS